MPDTEYLKIPRERVGVVIGKNGITKDEIENLTKTEIIVDSEAGTVAISPTEETEDPLSVWKARYIVKAIGRGFNPEISVKLMGDETILEIINLPDYVGKSKKAIFS